MSGTWSNTSNLLKTLCQHFSLRNFDETNYVISSGGKNNTTTHADITKFDFSSLSFSLRNFDPVTRFNHGGGQTVSGVSEWGGGENLGGTQHQSTVAHNDATNVVTSGANMLSARKAHNAGSGNGKRFKGAGKNGSGSFLNTSEKNDTGTYQSYATTPESQCYDGASGTASTNSDFLSKGQPSSGTATNILREALHGIGGFRNLGNDSVSRLRNTTHRSNSTADITCFGGSSTPTGTPYANVTEFTYSANVWASSSNAPTALAEHGMADGAHGNAVVVGGKTDLLNAIMAIGGLRNLGGK